MKKISYKEYWIIVLYNEKIWRQLYQQYATFGLYYFFFYKLESSLQYSWCSFSMMVKWANDGLLQANDGKMLVNDGERFVNDGEMMPMMVKAYMILLISPSLTSILPSLAWSKPSFAHLTISKKLHQLQYLISTYI